MFTVQYFISALLIGVFAFVYTNILTQHGEIFGKLFNRMYHFFKSDQRSSAGKSLHPLFKVLIQCEKCVAGQFALWSFLISQFGVYASGEWILIIPHLLFITLSIFMTITVKAIYKKLILPNLFD
jgi:hypothetical protein